MFGISLQSKWQLISIVMVFLILGSIGIVLYSRTTKEKTNDRLTVAASIFPVYDIVRNIADDKVDVIQLLPSGVSEHTFEPLSEDIQKAQQADIAFVIGELPFEEEILAGNTTVEKIYLYQGISLRDPVEEDEGDFDPHYWLSISNAKIIAGTIKDELKERDPKNGSFYESSYREYITKLDTLHADLKEKIDQLHNKEIITFHEAFAYFAEDFEFTILTTIEPFPGKEPTAEYLSEVGGIIIEKNVRVLFSEPQLSDQIIKPLADDYGVKIYSLDPVGGVGDIQSFESLMRYNVETIIEALS